MAKEKTMTEQRYEAYINGYWYPVKKISDLRYLSPGVLPVIDVEVLRHKCWVGYMMQSRPFTDYSCMGGGSSNKYGYVNPGSIRETTDDPLTTVYPKKN